MDAQAHVLLVRGVNVGGRNRLPMRSLRAELKRAGCARVRTYIQSGNAVFLATPEAARRGALRVASTVEELLGRPLPVILRTVGELAAAVDANPFPESEGEPRKLHLGFMAVRPSEARVAALDPDRSPPDEFAVRGREIYLLLPAGAAGSKLTAAYFDRVLGVATTFRNWQTVRRLLDLAKE